MAIARSYHQFAEALISGPAPARSYQEVAEVLSSGPTSAINYHQFAEVLLENSTCEAYSYQQFAEVLLEKNQATCFSYHQFVELLIEYDPVISISDRAYATSGFYMDEEGRMTINDHGTDATFNVSGSIEPSTEDPDQLSISDLAIATSTFVAENPTLIVLGDLAIATSTFTITSALHITSTAIASSKAGTVLNGNPGILAENRDPW